MADTAGQQGKAPPMAIRLIPSIWAPAVDRVIATVAVEAAALVVAESAGHSNLPCSEQETHGGWLYNATNLRCL